jgi:hypothetical protein
MSSTSDIKRLQRATRLLAARCDGAKARDGHGFNKIDARFGQELAAQDDWTDRQARAAYDMLEKYERQLHEAGIDIADVDRPEVSENVVLGVKDDRLVFRFSGPDFESIKEDVKALPYRRFVPENEGGPHWVVGDRTKEDLRALEDLIEAWDPFLTDAARRRLETARENADGPNDSSPAQHRVVLHDGVLALDFPYDEDVKDELKNHFSSWDWAPDAKLWLVDGNGELLDELDAWMETYPEFELGEDAKEYVARKREEVRQNREGSRAEDSDVMADYESASGHQLFGYQRAGVEYACENEHVLIADSMGLGKTIQALATLENKDAYPAVAVVPANLKQNWKREANEWVPERDVRILDGTTADELGDADLYVMNYAMLSRGADEWLTAFASEDLAGVILDESHYVKNEDANRSQAAADLADGVPVRLLLTGTPVLNRPQELVHQLRVLDQLGEFGGFWDFAKRYCDAHKEYVPGRGRVWDFSGASNTTELNQRLRETCMVRRQKSDVLSELPAKSHANVTLPADQDEHDEAVREFREWRRQADESELNAEAMVRIEKLKQAAVRGKLDAAIDWVEDFVASEKLVLFAMHRDVIDELRDAFPDTALIVEGQSGEEREREKERFQNDDDCRLLIGAMGAHAGASPAGLGHTLTAASNVAFLELGWTPAHHDQCVDRTHRIGQDEPVTAWYLMAKGTVEQDIKQVLDRKREVVDETTDGLAKDDVAPEHVAVDVADRVAAEG